MAEAAPDKAGKEPALEEPALKRLEQDSRRNQRVTKSLEELLEHAAVSVVRLDGSGVLRDVSRAFCQMLGCTRHDLVGRSLDEVTHVEDRAGAAEVRAALCSGALPVHSGEERLLRGDGSIVPIRRTSARVLNKRGKLCDLISIVEDLRETKRLTLRAVEAEDHYRTVLNALPDYVYVKDLAGRFEFANQAWLDARGQNLEQVRGKTVSDFYERKMARLLEQQDHVVISGEAPKVDHEHRTIRRGADGADFVRWSLTTKVPLRNAAGDIAGIVGVSRDITKRREAEDALQDSEQQLRAIFEYADVGIALSGFDYRYVKVNDTFCRIVGYRADELCRMSATEVNLEQNVEAMLERRRKLLHADVKNKRHETQLVRKDGSTVWVSIATTIIHDGAGAPRYFITVVQDISDAKRAAEALVESEEQFRQLAAHIPQVFWIADTILGEMVYVSPACAELMGVSVERLLSDQRLLVRSVHPEDRRRVYKARSLAPTGAYDETYRILRPDGTVRWVHDRAFPVRDAVGKIYRIAGIAEDITERKRAEEQLLELAHYDSVTDLPNRTLFADRLQQALVQAKRKSWTVAVMFVDVDRFKYVNDNLGHAAGDLLLRQVAERLVGCTRADDTVARLGGDEYAIVLNGLNAAEDAALVATKIMAALNVAFQLGQTELFVSASVGITLAPNDGTEPEVLLGQADTAMYRAKELGRKNFQFYKPEMNARTRELLTLERDLRHAIEREELVVHYQPKVCLKSGRITGAEALLRWKHPERGLVSPAEFMSVLEETGLIIPAGACVLRAVCRQINEWKSVNITTVRVAVNLSARQFLSRDLGQSVRAILDEYDIAPNLLELEITESSIMVDPNDAVRTLEYLESLGVAIAIDDFGTGYSSLAYLKRFPIGTLKIDRSFIRDITTDPDDAAITQAVISMAHSLSLRVVAEGVETVEQLEFLKRSGCDEGQGYLFSRPISGEDCARFILKTAST